MSKLHAILKPFVLRRLKTDVDIALPQKAEVLLYAHMTQDQKALNQQLLDGTLKVRLGGGGGEDTHALLHRQQPRISAFRLLVCSS